MRPILKNNVRILRPWEFDMLVEELEKRKRKYKYPEIVNALLYTGMRYVELERFHQHSEWFDKRAKVIYLPKEASRKKKRKMKDRYVFLSSQGIVHVENFIKYVDKLPLRVGINVVLKNAGADIDPVGLSVKTFRKTWESWLVASYPTMITLVAMSQGHTAVTALHHYLNIPFTKEDIEEIKIRTAGWGNVAHSTEVK